MSPHRLTSDRPLKQVQRVAGELLRQAATTPSPVTCANTSWTSITAMGSISTRVTGAATSTAVREHVSSMFATAS